MGQYVHQVTRAEQKITTVLLFYSYYEYKKTLKGTCIYNATQYKLTDKITSISVALATIVKIHSTAKHVSSGLAGLQHANQGPQSLRGSYVESGNNYVTGNQQKRHGPLGVIVINHSNNGKISTPLSPASVPNLLRHNLWAKSSKWQLLGPKNFNYQTVLLSQDRIGPNGPGGQTRLLGTETVQWNNFLPYGPLRLIHSSTRTGWQLLAYTGYVGTEPTPNNQRGLVIGNWKDDEWPPKRIIHYYGPATWAKNGSCCLGNTNKTGQSLTFLAQQETQIRNAIYQNRLALNYLLAAKGGVHRKFNLTNCCLQINNQGQVVKNIVRDVTKIAHVPRTQ
ncbi:Endogenous retrovirus group 3 member 1 Env polyprotein, partial [Plecturocebus cupreus]